MQEIKKCFLPDSFFNLERQEHQILQKIYYLRSFWKKGKIPELHHRDWEVLDFDMSMICKQGFAVCLPVSIKAFEILSPKKLKQNEVGDFISWIKENHLRYVDRFGKEYKQGEVDNVARDRAGRSITMMENGFFLSSDNAQRDPRFMSEEYYNFWSNSE